LASAPVVPTAENATENAAQVDQTAAENAAQVEEENIAQGPSLN
jgi:hypothetical protein